MVKRVREREPPANFLGASGTGASDALGSPARALLSMRFLKDFFTRSQTPRLCENSFHPQSVRSGGAGLSFILGVDRAQPLLWPESVKEDVPAEHPVRFLEAFVAARLQNDRGFSQGQGAGLPGALPARILILLAGDVALVQRGDNMLRKIAVQLMHVRACTIL